MSYTITEIDQDTLPDELLEPTKDHLNIDFPDDDDKIKRFIRWSIAYVQHFSGLQIFAGTVTMSPAGGTERVQCPVQPVNPTFVAKDANQVDVTAQYRLMTSALTSPVWLYRVDGGVMPSGITFALKGGYEDPADMDPAMEANIMRVAATMYEHRESVSTFNLDEVPFWLNDMLSIWVPRC